MTAVIDFYHCSITGNNVCGGAVHQSSDIETEQPLAVAVIYEAIRPTFIAA